MAQTNRNRYYLLTSAIAAIIAIALWNYSEKNNIDQDHEEDHEHEEFVVLTPEQIEIAGILIEPAQSGHLQNTLRAHGKILLNGNHVAHVVPKMEGIVKNVYKNEGEDVLEGEALALMESREIAQAKSDYLAALNEEKIASQLLMMEQDLYGKNITSNQDFQSALKEAGNTSNKLELARQKLYVLGLTKNDVAAIETGDPAQLRYYEIISPLSGTVLHRHATLGELLNPNSEAFTVANLDHLWVEISVYPNDQPYIQKGAFIRIDNLNGDVGSAKIVYINPVIDEHTRKAKAIALLDNRNRTWNPGSYVTVEIDTDKQPVSLLVPKEAVQSIEGSNCVFVQAENGFEIRPVQTGKCDGKRTEIISGLNKGEKVAIHNTFLLKADHLKNEAEHEH